MRHANRAILMTRHISPTIDELIADLNGATAFSKLDLKSGYHQLELHLSCRYITTYTFSTHEGLYQYKRLGFGMPQRFSNTKMFVTTWCLDGRNQNKHSASLNQTLRRLHESGITINLTKCEFNKLSIEFFVYILSAEGLAPALSPATAMPNFSPFK